MSGFGRRMRVALASWRWPLTAVGLSLAGTVATYAAFLVTTNNFHTVIPGVLYRSAQPGAGDIDRYAADYGIRTILNLRGKNDSDWYEDEVAAALANGIDHIDFGLSAGRRLDGADTAELIAILKSAKTPILIHCKSGSDRTGLVAALYLAAVAMAGEEAAESQLSILYGHVSVPGLYTYEMDMSFEDAEPSLGFFGS